MSGLDPIARGLAVQAGSASSANTARLAAQLASGLSPAAMMRWNTARAKVTSGAGDAVLAVIGDSTTAGQGAGDGPAPYTANARARAVPARLAARLIALGIPASSDGVFADNVIEATHLVSSYTAYNPAVSVSSSGTSDWYIESLAVPGGYCWRNDTGTGAWSLTPANTFNQIDLYFLKAIGNASLTVSVGGTTVGTIDTSATGSTQFLKATLSTGSAAATGTIAIKRSGTGMVRLVGVVPRDSAVSRVQVLNLGGAGWRSSNWADATGVWSPARAITTIAPDLAIINIGLNDLANSSAGTPVPLATYLANLRVLLASLGTVGSSVVLATPPPQNPATRDPTLAYPVYNAALAQLAASSGYGLIDLYRRFVSYAATSAAGYYRDDVHMQAPGYANIGDVLARMAAAS